MIDDDLIVTRPGHSILKKNLAYETLSETEWAPPIGDSAFIPNVFVNIANYIEQKIEAMTYYHS